MLKGSIVLLSILLINGCAERGYKLTVNQQKQTATAEHVSSLDDDKSDNVVALGKMKKAVKIALQKNKNDSVSKQSKSIHIPILNDNELLYSDTQNLHFVRVNQTYQKFGNSELHGHVIYMSKLGEEKRLNNTRIYLLPLSEKVEKWYNNAYLKNRTQITSTVTVKYLNTTYLNLNRNFSFHGIAEGDYIVIIVSDALADSNKKVYIAKKMKIEKRKKIMAVFSKKL